MDVPAWVPVVAMAVGVILMLRATAIVATKGEGRFHADPLVSILVGFGLILLGQYLL
ncbi:hypothetical protein [Nocardioides sp. W7]|uniref:hypothetical protein n=1 Tax=Nocardioides sp. W7 TaxID=2931390 RepID=UPI001FD0B7DE|nr:hypothetical protein [Nocardioides sp. W7]